MKLIPLTQGKFAIVDDSDFETLSKFKWHALKVKNGYYAARTTHTLEGKRILLLMHASIASTPPGMQTLHLNGNGLDNRHTNLRVGTRTENGRGHRKRQSNNTSGFRGVYWDKALQKWRAKIKHDGQKYHIGYYNDLREAAQARDARARELGWPEEGMNFPQ